MIYSVFKVFVFIFISLISVSSFSQPIISLISKQEIDENIYTKATYKLDAIVLSKKRYTFDKESKYSNYDIAVGWNKMSDPQILSQFKITQNNRWFFWSHERSLVGITRSEIINSGTNIHLISSNDYITKMIKKLEPYDMIYIEGYLVDVFDKNWRWISSTSFSDSGDGACEILYVTKLIIK